MLKDKQNYRLPKGTDAEKLTKEDALRLLKTVIKPKRVLKNTMVDLNDYFNPVSIERPDFEHLTGQAGFPHNITIHTENTPVKDISKYQDCNYWST